MKSIVNCALVGACWTLAACHGPDKACQDLAENVSTVSDAAYITKWVDDQDEAGKLDPRNKVPDGIFFRPGDYAIALTLNREKLGLSKDAVARVVVDEHSRPLSVFIGANSSQGYIVELAHSNRIGLAKDILTPVTDRLFVMCVRPTRD